MTVRVIYNGEMGAHPLKEVLGRTIRQLADGNKKIIYLDADLMSCICMREWAEKNPDRGINCGIAEANMIGIAAGLSAVGFQPLVHTFCAFASRRCYDQVFLSCGYAQNSITVIGSDPGVCAAFNGGTHTAFEDMALYRAIPGSTVIDISDENQLISALIQTGGKKGLTYIRTPRKSAAKLYGDYSHMPVGKGILLREGKDAAVFACGIMVCEAMKAAEQLEREGIFVSVIDMFTVKPLDEECLLRHAKAEGLVVTAENHNKIGGLYSAVTEVLAEKLPVPVECVAAEDCFGEVGPQEYLQEKFGLNSNEIVKKVKRGLERRTKRSQK